MKYQLIIRLQVDSEDFATPKDCRDWVEAALMTHSGERRLISQVHVREADLPSAVSLGTDLPTACLPEEAPAPATALAMLPPPQDDSMLS